MRSKYAVKIIVNEVAYQIKGRPEVKYTIIIPRKNGATEMRGNCKLGETIGVTKAELKGD